MSIVLGDIHGRWNVINHIVNSCRPDVIFQLGDFGIWREMWEVDNIHIGDTKLYFIPGNHENWDVLDRYELGKIHEVGRNIFYCAFGSMLTYQNQNILFCGGADSIDKGFRTEKVDWWRQEIITQRDMDTLPNAHTKVDVVMSHTSPEYFDLKMPVIDYFDPSTRALSMVYDMYHPKKWFLGHFHKSISGNYKNCQWFCLNQEEKREF